MQKVELYGTYDMHTCITVAFLHNTQECYENYDHIFANEFEQFLSKEPVAVAHTSKDQSEAANYIWYIENHLKGKKCPSFCAKLW